jgi:Rrf2 family protein
VRATQQLKYALYGVFDLAYHGGDRPVRIQEIGERQGIPARYLEQIFQKLRRAGLVHSKRGPGGGYVLARPAEAITLADVIVAVQGSVLREPAAEGGEPATAFIWEELRGALQGVLARRSVAELCSEAARRGVARLGAEPASYDI